MEDEAVFAMYFSTVAGWQFHPGSGHGEHKLLTLEQSASVALSMLEIHRQIFGVSPKEV